MRSGYSSAQVARITGLSYRQIDDYDRTGLVHPSLVEARGSGSSRRYSREDVDKLVMIRKLLDAGVSLRRIKRDRDPAITAEAVSVAMGHVLEGVA